MGIIPIFKKLQDDKFCERKTFVGQETLANICRQTKEQFKINSTAC